MPIGMVSTLDPIQQIYATGWIYRRAITGDQPPIAFWGMLIIFGPTTLIVVLGIVWRLSYSVPGTTLSGGIIKGLLIGGLFLAILVRVTKSYIKHLKYKPGSCKHCGYNIRHLPKARCPECGTSFDPDELPGASASEPTADWEPPNCHSIQEQDYPIKCVACGGSLDSLGEDGTCPSCRTDFIRSDRLFDRYGPEIFVGSVDDQIPVPVAGPASTHTLPRDLRGAVVLTGVSVVTAFAFPTLIEQGYVGVDRWVFVGLLFVVTVLSWWHVLRDRTD